jgi:hypothetical protein
MGFLLFYLTLAIVALFCCYGLVVGFFWLFAVIAMALTENRGCRRVTHNKN